MTAQTTKRRAILVFTLDRPGVLNKISSLIRRKMFNVDTITACASKRPDVHRITITLREDDEAKVLQVIHQIEKVTEVIIAKELDTNDSFWREAAVIKVETDQNIFDQLRRNYEFSILEHQNHDLYIIQVAGTSQYIDNFLSALGHDKVIEIARTGVTALEN